MMVDLNDLRVFERVASLRSFAAAAQALSVPRSGVTRAIQRLETTIGSRLMQRTPREVTLTYAGEVLLHKVRPVLESLSDAVGSVESLADVPTGRLVIGVGAAFGTKIVSGLLPAFIARHPGVDVVLRIGGALKSDGDEIDVSIRMGPLPPSTTVVRSIGAMPRDLCASPAYMSDKEIPKEPNDLGRYDIVEYPGRGDRMIRPWVFTKGDDSQTVALAPRIQANDALAIHQIVVAGGGIAGISSYLCTDDLLAGRLVRLLTDWRLDFTEVHVAFPSKRELAPAVRAFVSFLDGHEEHRKLWQRASH